MIREKYISKELRDARYKELKAQGKSVYKSVAKGQCLHPAYVADFADKAIQADNGFGNTHYQTYFSKLYIVEEIM